MASLKFDVEPPLYREIKAAQREGVDIVLIPSDAYARITRAGVANAQLMILEAVTKGTENITNPTKKMIAARQTIEDLRAERDAILSKLEADKARRTA